MKIVIQGVILLSLFFCLPASLLAQSSAQDYLQQGWKELVRDKDSNAYASFSEAYRLALNQQDRALAGDALLHMGMCTYGVSYVRGLKYALMSLEEFDRLKVHNPPKAREGRARALQLISTIYARQGKYKEALSLSLQALEGIAPNDTTATLGLIYSSLGNLYDKLAQPDSSAYFYQEALKEHLVKNNITYLPTAYINQGTSILKGGNKEQALLFFERAWHIADSMDNRQAMVSALLALASWHQEAANNSLAAGRYLASAKKIADSLSDKQFLIRVLKAQVVLNVSVQHFENAFLRQKEISLLEENYFHVEKDQTTAMLEAQFRVSEKERALEALQSERKIIKLTSLLLGVGMLAILVVGAIVVVSLKKVNRKNRELLATQAELKRLDEQQQLEKERGWHQDLEQKEHQLSALTLQMFQKNEMMQQLQQELENANVQSMEVTKIINKGMIQDQEWDNFNVYFQSINKNFYSKIKATFPEVTANDLKICALIKLDLSIKEIAGILNISPDSVKTARYRLRKKLQLPTEENLAEFIRNIG